MKNLKMSAKLLTGYAIVIAFAIIVGVVGIIGLFTIDDSYTQAYIDTALPLPIMANAIEELTTIGIHTRDAVLYTDDLSRLQEAITGATNAMENFEVHMEKYELTITNFDSQAEFYKALEAYKNNYKPSVQGIIDFAEAGNQAGALELLNNISETRLALSENLRDCLQHDFAEGEKKVLIIHLSRVCSFIF